MVTKLKTGTKVGQLGIWDGTQWVAGDPDCNIVKWGGTALTARDITTLLDHLNVDLSTRALEAGGNLAAILSKLDVALSTKARLQPWYQTNFTPINRLYTGVNVAPHTATERWNYTVPASRIAIIRSALTLMMRQTAPTTLDRAYVSIFITDASDVPVGMVCESYEQTATIGLVNRSDKSESAILTAGQKLKSNTLDASTGGTYVFHTSVNIAEFDV